MSFRHVVGSHFVEWSLSKRDVRFSRSVTLANCPCHKKVAWRASSRCPHCNLVTCRQTQYAFYRLASCPAPNWIAGLRLLDSRVLTASLPANNGLRERERKRGRLLRDVQAHRPVHAKSNSKPAGAFTRFPRRALNSFSSRFALRHLDASYFAFTSVL